MSLSRQVACRGYAEALAHPAHSSEETTGPPAAAETSAAPPLRSVHTTNFPALLDQLGISLLVTTYQAGKLVVLRADQDHVNTQFRNLSKPMGILLDDFDDAQYSSEQSFGRVRRVREDAQHPRSEATPDVHDAPRRMVRHRRLDAPYSATRLGCGRERHRCPP